MKNDLSKLLIVNIKIYIVLKKNTLIIHFIMKNNQLLDNTRMLFDQSHGSNSVTKLDWSEFEDIIVVGARGMF